MMLEPVLWVDCMGIVIIVGFLGPSNEATREIVLGVDAA